LDQAAAPYLVPGGDGSVQVEWHEKHGELELDVDRGGNLSIWGRDHRNGAEFEGEAEMAIDLFYRWAPWVATAVRDGADASVSSAPPSISVAA
jgi:hypothetical protein